MDNDDKIYILAKQFDLLFSTICALYYHNGKWDNDAAHDIHLEINKISCDLYKLKEAENESKQ